MDIFHKQYSEVCQTKASVVGEGKDYIEVNGVGDDDKAQEKLWIGFGHRFNKPKLY